MRVLKRNGQVEEVKFDKITQRIQILIQGLDKKIDPVVVAGKVCSEVYDKIPTSELSNMFDHYEKLRKPAATAHLNQGRSTANLTLDSGTIKSWCYRTAISWLPNSLLSSFLFKADEQNNPALIECGLEPCRVSLFS